MHLAQRIKSYEVLEWSKSSVGFLPKELLNARIANASPP
jgi:hypothetical protein